MADDEVEIADMSDAPAGVVRAPINAFAALLEHERANGFASLHGSRAEIAVPVRQSLVDWILHQALARRGATGVRVDLLQGARLGVEVTHNVLGIPARARTVLTIEPAADLDRGRVVLRHADSLLWRTIRTVVGALGLLPPGVSFGPGAIGVDLGVMAARAGWPEALPWLQRLRFEGPLDGLLLVDAALEIRPTPNAVPPQARGGSTSAASRPIDVDALLVHLAGARARLELHVTDGIVNDAIAAARTLLERPPDGPAAPSIDARRLAAFVGDVAVRFEPGRLVAKVDLHVPDAPPLTTENGEDGAGTTTG